jgi:type I restriction enzyme S subunit
VKQIKALNTELDQLRQLQELTHSELDSLMPSILDKAFKGEL